MSHLECEIRSQPEVLEKILRQEGKRVERVAGRIREKGIRTFFLVARGSSDNAGLYAKYLFGIHNRMVVALAAPSMFTLYRRPPDLSGCLVLAISQSGESDDLCQVVADARRQGAWTLAVTNRARSPLAAEAEQTLSLCAGRERSVAATKTYTAELMLMAMLSAALRGTARARDPLERVPQALEETLAASERVAGAAQRYRFAERLSVIGRGYNYATCFELALKLKELAYLPAEPSSSADFRHGPIAMVERDFPVLLVGPRWKTLPDMLELAGELSDRKAEILAISDSRKLLKLSATPFRLAGGLPEWLTPLVAAVPGQLLALHLARARGIEVDRPRGLNKVTRTR